jgi:hypothetical protein
LKIREAFINRKKRSMKNLKKKVALLLAFVMVLSLVPMNVFGAARLFPTATTPGLTPADITIEIPANLFNGQAATPGGISLMVEFGGVPSWATFGVGRYSTMSGQNPTGTTPAAVVSALGAGANTATVSQLGARAFLVYLTGNGSIINVTDPTQTITITFRANISADAANAHVTVTNMNTGTVLLNQARLANFPANGVRMAIGAETAPSFNEVLALPPIRITELSPGQFLRAAAGVPHLSGTDNDVYTTVSVAGRDVLAIQLNAPSGYRWAQQLLGTAAPSVTLHTLTGPKILASSVRVTASDNNDLSIFVTFEEPDTAPERLAGTISINNLFLMPVAAHVAPTGNVNVNVRLGATRNGAATTAAAITTSTLEFARATDQTGNRALWEGGVVVGSRVADVMGMGTVSLSMRVADHAADATSSLWTGTTHGWWPRHIIRLEESVYGAWDTGVELSSLNIALPAGVRAQEVEYRVGPANNMPNSWEGSLGTAFPVGAIFGSTTVARMASNNSRIEMFLERVEGAPGQNVRRAVEISFFLEARPGFGAGATNGVVAVTASGTAVNRIVGQNVVTISQFSDPVTVELDGPLARVIATDSLGLVSAANLSDIVITEAAAGRLAAGTAIDVTIRNNEGFVTPSLGRPNFAVEPATAGGSTHLGVSWVEEISNGWRIHISSPSRDGNPGAIRLSGMTMVGTIMDAPDVFNYEVRVAGDAIRAVTADNFGTFYTIPVITFGPTQGTPGGPGEGPGPGTGPIVNGGSATFNANTAIAGVEQPIQNVGGVPFISIRAFAGMLMPQYRENMDAIAVWANVDGVRQGTLEMEDVNGNKVVISGFRLDSRVVYVDGVAYNLSQAVTSIDGRVMLPVVEFASLLGYKVELVGGGLAQSLVISW